MRGNLASRMCDSGCFFVALGDFGGLCEKQKNLKKGLKKGEVWFTMEPSGEKW